MSASPPATYSYGHPQRQGSVASADAPVPSRRNPPASLSCRQGRAGSEMSATSLIPARPTFSHSRRRRDSDASTDTTVPPCNPLVPLSRHRGRAGSEMSATSLIPSPHNLSRRQGRAGSEMSATSLIPPPHSPGSISHSPMPSRSLVQRRTSPRFSPFPQNTSRSTARVTAHGVETRTSPAIHLDIFLHKRI
jgi:hypothetical protein